jgi:hypothetical protein
MKPPEPGNRNRRYSADERVGTRAREPTNVRHSNTKAECMPPRLARKQTRCDGQTASVQNTPEINVAKWGGRIPQCTRVVRRFHPMSFAVATIIAIPTSRVSRIIG